MSHRVRSRTVDSADGKKPRRLTEKIAIMKKREHEQSEAFEHAMKSIHEMQRARIHSGGGSMPSLQAIDSTPPTPSIDMQMVFQDYNEVTTLGGSKSSKDRPHSSESSGRRGTVAKAISMDTNPYPNPGINPEYYWNASPSEWMEGDLSRHKSDSDLQQSLMMQQHQQQHQQHHQQQRAPQHSPLHSPLTLDSSHQPFRNHKLNSPTDLSMWRRTNSASTAHALLSPDQYLSNPDVPVPSSLSLSGAGGTTSSLPDLTNIEFSSGLEVPLEKDEPHSHPPADFTHQPQVFVQQQQQVESRAFFSPSSSSSSSSSSTASPLSSKLYYAPCATPPSSLNNVHMLSQPPLPSPPQPRYTGGYQIPIPPLSSGPKQGVRPNSPLTAFRAMPSISGGGGGRGGGISKSQTMPNFNSTTVSSHVSSHDYPFTRLKPNGLQSTDISQFRSPLSSFMPPMIGDPLKQGTCNAGILSPVTIVLQSPHSVQGGISTTENNHQHQQILQIQQQVQQQQQQIQQQVQQEQQLRPRFCDTTTAQQTLEQQQEVHMQQHQQLYHVQHQQQAGSVSPTLTSPPQALPPNSYYNNNNTAMDSSLPPESPSKSLPSFHGGASLPSTPTSSFHLPGSGMAFVLPSYLEARQHQSLQEKFASINVGKAEALIRSHSEENLQKIQKEKTELIQQNPFMGSLTNANSVPCVYVESQSTDQLQDRADSPTNLDSPSTSASYASSPPSVRPFWLDHSNSLNEFMFHEWPLESGASFTSGGGGGGYRSGSPPLHHRSLTDLIQNTIPELSEMSPNNRNKTYMHQLSLPSVAMMDLTTEEHMDRQNPGSPSEFLVPPNEDFDMEESVMDIIKNELHVPDLHSFDSYMLNSVAAGTLLSSSPEPYLHN